MAKGMGLDLLTKATEGAFKKLHRQMGDPFDTDLIFYNSLTPEDIEGIKDKYGSDGLLAYIKKMEMKTMKEQHNGIVS